MKRYIIDGNTFDHLPDPCKGLSPVYEDTFVNELGGTIEDDGEPTPEQAVCGEFAELIADLASKTDKITPEEFLQAAQKGISFDLITLARSKKVSEDVIAEGRARIVEIMADALRYGITWDKLIQGVTPK